MKVSKQEVVINYSAKNLYNIVLDVEKYPEFIPWCESIIVTKKLRNEIFADMIVSYKSFLPQAFSSHVFFDSKSLSIETKFIKGPLNDLKTKWFFKQIDKKKTKVLFKIEFEFKTLLHQKLAELFFNLIKNKMIDSFKSRAKEVLN